jgi:hypothetical protein
VEKGKDYNVLSLSKKPAANRRNSLLSTGPKTERGKNWSRRNALKHGILASALLLTQGEGAEDQAAFDELLGGLSRDLAPVGMLEEMQVEKIAVCWWRQKRALECEAGLVGHSFVPNPGNVVYQEFSRSGGKWNPELKAIKEQLRLPLGDNLDLILRYETTIQLQLIYAVNLLERLQRARKGEHVPAPVSIQVSSDQQT